MPTRSTEASGECYGRTVLSYLRPQDERPASFFILGDVLHRTIEGSIENDWDLSQAKIALLAIAYEELYKVKDAVVVEGMQRSMESLLEDADRMITNWFAHVHPDSDKRHPFYDDYQWPPATEVPFYRTDLGTRYPVWGRIDAVFEARVEEAINYNTGNGLAIVDWKSSVKRPDTQFQLDYYRFGMGWHEAEAAFHMLDRVRKQSIVVPAAPYPSSELALREMISSTERAKAQTVAGQLPKFTPGWYCGYCTVQHICPADGDPRMRSKNEKQLIRILSKAEAMNEIPGAETSVAAPKGGSGDSAVNEGKL